jgi:peptidoglycan/xylan/chitin deacetylase (PgdA/CDA1 family)
MSTVSIFMYHDIRDVNPNDRFYNRYQNRSFVNVQQFKNQLSYMKDRFQFISPFHIKSALQDKSNTHYAVMTFDDGLIDHYDVLPLLDKYKIIGTFFIPGNVLDKNFIIDSNQVQLLESEVDMYTLAQEILDLLGDEKEEAWDKYSKSKFRVNTWPKEKTFITNCLRDHPKDLLNPLFRKYISNDYESISNMFYLNEKQIIEMSNANHVIGGHGFASKNLLLFDTSDMIKDLYLTKEFVSKYQNKFIFSYPNGRYNDVIVESLKSFDCQYSFTTEDKSLTEFDIYEELKLPRYCAPQRIPYD